METVNKKNRRRLSGIVVKDKMDKTVVVQVSNAKVHAKYLKRMVTSNKYHVHDEDNTACVGDKVIIEETRPLSKTKTWRIVKVSKE